MSAFIVSDCHIDVLVSWAMDHKAGAFPKLTGPAQLGALLHEENCKSVDYRYDEANPRDYRFTYRPEARALSAVQIIKACHCLGYQSCEHPGWPESLACSLLKQIEGHAVSRLPGYEEARWSLDEKALA